MKHFRFAIMGAGGIAVKFCEAVWVMGSRNQQGESSPEVCEICAVASKSITRAQDFAEKNGIAHFYDSYEQMLEMEKPDCVYIAVTPNDHYRLTMLCIEHATPVLCEKAMFQSGAEARMAFAAAEENHVFVMEALWSRYLPAVRKVKKWLEEGKTGVPEIVQCMIGFAAPQGKNNRYFSAELGGGAAKDITVYAYEITEFLLNQEIRKIYTSALWSETGVDVVNHVSIEFEYTLADLTTSFLNRLEEKMVIYGEKGKIVLPHPHFASECMLYDEQGNLSEHYTDDRTQNGFVYEIEDVMRCIRENRIQSRIVPWKDTLACAELFDRLELTRTQ